MTHSIRFALAEDSGDENAESTENWMRADPFGENPMRRLTLGTIGTGKTVSAMATASRVRDTVPDARIVVFSPIPGEYDPLAYTLSEKSLESETGDIPSAKRFRVGDEGTLPTSASDLPAVSIIEPERTLPERGDSLREVVEDFVAELSEAERQCPTYLILDEAHYIFRPESAFGINELIQAQQEHGALAVQIVEQTLDGGRFVAAMGDEDVHSPLRAFNTFDLYHTNSREQRKRLGLSTDDAEFLRHEAVRVLNRRPLFGKQRPLDCAKRQTETGNERDIRSPNTKPRRFWRREIFRPRPKRTGPRARIVTNDTAKGQGESDQ
jgi:hypothetical protein